MRRSVAAAIFVAALTALTALAPMPAAAATDADAPLQPAFLEVEVNATPGDAVLVHLAPNGDVWLAAAELTRRGLVGVEGTRRTLDGDVVVSLRSLAPGLAFEVDERALKLRITAGRALLGASAFDLGRAARPKDLRVSAMPGGFLNYGVLGTTAGDASGSAELGLTSGTGLFVSSLSVSAQGDAVRGLSTGTLEEVDRLRRWSAGDVVAQGDALGGSGVLLGFGVAKDLALDPYFVQAPLPSASGFAATPSVLEVWVNGALVRELQVAPGTYALDNIPVRTGTNEVRTVVRDAFGRRQEVDSTSYLATGLIRPGVRDWSYALGLVRRSFGVESFDYGALAFQGRHRQGLTPRLTGSLRLEASAGGLVSGGGSIITGTRWGELEAGLAASVDGMAGASGPTASGLAGLVAWRLSSNRFSSVIYAQALSPRYANLSLPSGENRELWRAGAALGAYWRWGSVSLDYTASRPRSGGIAGNGGVRASLPLGRGTSFVLAATGERGPATPTALAVSGSFVAVLGQRSVLDTSASIPSGGGRSPTATAGFQHWLPAGEGVGYRVRGTVDDDRSVGNAGLEAQASFGRVEATGDVDSLGQTSGTASLSGAIVAVPRKWFLSRPVSQGFALVDVGVPGVRTYFENQEVARTGKDGLALVYGMVPYYGHRIGISDQDVPPEYTIPTTLKTAAAPTRGVTLVRFEVEKLVAITGTLRVTSAEGLVAPKYGTLRAGAASSPIGGEGAFWLEGVKPGRHAAEITWDGGTCAFTLSVPDEGSGIVDLGTVRCGAAEP